MIVYPYNEILPKRNAHDVYVFQNVCSLANIQDATLLIGKGSLDNNDLFAHYNSGESSKINIERLPILRKNNPLNISWNRVFFYFSQKRIKELSPKFVFLSVLSQAHYHLQRKLPGIRYIYEAHELAYYPGMEFSEKAAFEKDILSKADLITVTTYEMQKILQNAPYNLKKPIVVVPLAVNATPLTLNQQSPMTFGYSGQLYESQGIKRLIEALTSTPHRLKIIGGKPHEIQNLQNLCSKLSISDRVQFTGFVPPGSLNSHVKDCHVLVAPFEPTTRMPYVAHTKLMEYYEWKRPIIAPDLPVVREHLSERDGVLFFKPGNTESLSQNLQTLDFESLNSRALLRPKRFSWQKRASSLCNLIEAGKFP